MLGENSKVTFVCPSVAVEAYKHLERGLHRTVA